MQTVKITNESDLAKIAQNGDFNQHGAVVALGFFDGLHKAHRELIASARAAAKEKDLRLVIFTFSGDDNLLKTNVKKLFTDEEKLSLLEECGADCTVLANFAVFDFYRIIADFEKPFGFLINNPNLFGFFRQRYREKIP